MDYNKSMRNIGQSCADYRKNVLRMTQEEIAKESGYSQATISAFEKGASFSTRVLMWYVAKGYDGGKLSGLIEEG